MTLTRSFSEPPECFGEQSLRSRQAERSASTFDLEGCISKRHFHGAPAAGSLMSSHEASLRHATMDIDACSRRRPAPSSARGAMPEGSGLRGWRHTSYDVASRTSRKHFWQPFTADGYDGVTNTSRRAIFDQSVRAEEYAMLLGRPMSYREHPKRCSNKGSRQSCRSTAYAAEEIPSQLGLRRVLTSLLPEDSDFSRRLEAVAARELQRQGAVAPTRLSTHRTRKPRMQNPAYAQTQRSPKRDNTSAHCSTAGQNSLREQTAGPTLLRSAARQGKVYEKPLPQKPSSGATAGNVANLLLQESVRLRQESERLMAKAEQLQQEAGRHQEMQTPLVDATMHLGTPSISKLETSQDDASHVQ